MKNLLPMIINSETAPYYNISFCGFIVATVNSKDADSAKQLYANANSKIDWRELKAREVHRS